ncbi:MAG: DUF5110 domain-containing protein [Bacteroides sp.]|nr:DUF5110 domain-containing protein [Bacteroides sp.]
MKKIGLFCAALVVALRCLGITNGVISTTTPSGRHVVVKAMDGNVFRVSNTASGETPKTTQAAALAVGEFHGGVAGDSINAVLALPSGVSATLNRRSGAVTFRDSSGRLLTDEGMRENKAGLRSIKLIPSEKGGAFYGGGERGHSFDVQSDTLVMYNRQNYGYTEGDPRISQMNICVPLFVSKNGGYGVLFDDYAAAKLIMGDPIVYATESPQPVSYYFIYGEGTLSGVVREYSALTGRQKLPPFWALGYITSKYGYKTEAETRGVIDTLKTEGYPVDGVVLDLYWYGKETDMGRLEWNKDQWQNHKGMLADLKKQGVNTVIISQPYINKIGAIDNYNELASKGLLTKDKDGNINDVTTWVGEAGMFDVANPDTRRWLRERYRALTDEGVTGWWGDLGEPEVHPETIVHANGETARQYHNVYGNVWSSIIYDLFNDEYPDTRLMTLMRGGTTGLQRYSVFPWSTDVSRSWGGLQPQVKIMLNSGLSGLGYMSHDVGGFAIDEANPIDPELYVRWLQLGTFSPVLRTHSQRFAEPYHYPEYRDIILPLVKMRYEWLPYNYTLAYENAAKGYPLVRPLNFESVGATPYDSIVDEYMWGSEVLVAPVLEKGAVSREVVFPAGVWIDYADPAMAYAGPDTVTYAAPLDRLPLFIKNGAFIPLAEYEMENTGEYDASRYTVRYYPRGYVRSSYTMYEDNRLSNSSLERGDFALIQFDGDASAKEIRVKMELTGDYPGMAADKEISLELPGIAPTDIAGVTVNGKAVTIGEKMLKIGIALNVNSPVNVVIKKK